jgi:hypothetical protein
MVTFTTRSEQLGAQASKRILTFESALLEVLTQCRNPPRMDLALDDDAALVQA